MEHTPNTDPNPFLFPTWLGRLWMWFFGWTVTGTRPDFPKYIIIGAPHTSNWDFPFMLAAAAIIGIRVSWMGKNTIFKKPFGGLMRKLGGIPIDRSKASGVVTQMAEQFNTCNRLALLIPPSGTRRKQDYWKSGFYWIAHTAQVPIVCAYMDYPRKVAGIGFSFVPTGNVNADMERVREFYRGIEGKHPELTDNIRLREEDSLENGD